MKALGGTLNANLSCQEAKTRLTTEEYFRPNFVFTYRRRGGGSGARIGLTGCAVSLCTAASAVARSLRCNVPSVAAPPDPPSLNHKSAAGHDGEEGESDSLYNVWLDKEYFHNPKSGENYWVSPSSDYQQNGPQGPGYYATYGNDVIKLQSGYAQ